MDDFFPEIDERINPCEGCEDYEAPKGCKSKGGCGRPEYITKSAALTVFGHIQPLDYNTVAYAEKIKALPAANVVEVKHGRWVKMKGMMPPEYHGHYECSECGWHPHRMRSTEDREEEFTYCPNCGAIMDGGQDK